MRRMLLAALLLLVCGGHAEAFDPYGEPVQNFYYEIASADGAQTNKVLITGVTGLRIVVNGITVTCSNANTVDTSFLTGFSSSGTLSSASTTNNTKLVAGHPKIPAGGGLSLIGGGAPLARSLQGESLLMNMGAPTTGACDVRGTFWLMP